MSPPQKDSQKSIPLSLLSLAILLGGDSGFRDAVENGASIASLNELVKTAACRVGFQFPSEKSRQQAYETVFSRIGRYGDSVLKNNSYALRFLQLLRERQARTKTAQKSRHNYANRLGLIDKEPNRCYPSDLKVIELDRLPLADIYPPFNHRILEVPYQTLPAPPKVVDRTCAYSDKYHVLVESNLQYTIGEHESAVILDRATKEIVTIVIRGFVKSYYDSVEQWSSGLVIEALNRRRPTLRNNPGMAQIGVSTGSRQAPLFGWVRNLHDKYKRANDHQIHEQKLSSLFGFFYSLIRGQLPIVASKFEQVLADSGAPRYDQQDSQQFALPFENGPTFDCNHLAPPEGYITHNFSKEIHRDGHWKGCNMGVYWNISRRQVDGRVGRESGANFFVSDYGLRIINAANSCVVWDISSTHGTGVFENGLEQVVITILLSRMTELSWARYNEKYITGLLQPHELLWPETSPHGDIIYEEENEEEIEE